MQTSRKKISNTAKLEDAIADMSEGNPGALRVLLELVKNDPKGVFDVLHLDDMNMRGSQIWLGYKDFCKEDLKAFRKAIRARDPEMIACVNGEPQELNETAVVSGGSKAHL